MDYQNSELTIIIVLYEEEADLLLRCLENIKNYKIIIVDNAGNSSLKKRVEEKFKIYKYILNKKNLGLAKAANQGIKQCDTEYILNLNADCLISNEDILTLLQSHKKYKNCFITSPTFYDEESKLSYNGGYLPENGDRKTILDLEGDVCTEAVLATAILFRKKDILEIGLLDENLFIYYLDDELCRRIKQQKRSVIQIFNTTVQHVHGQLKVKNLLKKIFIRNYYFTFDELYYYFKANQYHKKFNYLKKKIPNYIIKTIINFLILRLNKSVYYFAKIAAFYNFNKLLNKKS